jgi:hypothetical protein
MAIALSFSVKGGGYILHQWAVETKITAGL